MTQFGKWRPLKVQGQGWIILRTFDTGDALGSEILATPSGANRLFADKIDAQRVAVAMNDAERVQRTLIDAPHAPT